jgi:hypothetical protein
MTYLCRRCRTIHVRLVIQLLELLQCCAWLLRQTDNDRLAVVVTNGETGWRALLGWLEEVVDTIAVDLEILQRNLNLCGARGVLFNLLAPPVYGTQESWDYATVGQRLPSTHCMCLAGTGAAVREDG